MTQFFVYRTTKYCSGFDLGTELSPDELSLMDAGLVMHIIGTCESARVYAWASIAPMTLTAALVGAFVVLLGVGILRKVYRT